MANWYRSFPAKPQDKVGKAHVEDSIPKLFMHDYDYLTINPWPQHDLFLLEWDIAMDKRTRTAFQTITRQWTRKLGNKIIVAPYRLTSGEYVHRQATGLPVKEPWSDPLCATFGMGAIYLPWHIVKEWLATKPDRWTDGTFSEWYYNTHGPTPIVWSVCVAHLHS